MRPIPLPFNRGGIVKARSREEVEKEVKNTILEYSKIQEIDEEKVERLLSEFEIDLLEESGAVLLPEKD